ncbi:hypothetical protein ACFFGT_06740 [Mucilaginibacter angelicae]|uniref:Uncharacterized protein n=1 Tax=Mucilaginibacter angelicae TaxID=869718 RepID=A0ABV6L335_9SPHI
MKKNIIILAILIIVLAGMWWAFKIFVLHTNLNRQPELTNFHESHFEVSSSKPLYFKIDSGLYCAMDGKFTYQLKPVWKGEIEEAYISPDGKYAVIYNKNKLLLIDNNGKSLFKIDNCTNLIAVSENRDSGRFIASSVQWSKNSDSFLVLQDKVWDGNYSKKNRSSIYKYSLADKSFKPFMDLDEEVIEYFALSTDGTKLYYEFATPKGDLAFKKIDLKTRKILSEHFSDDSLRLKGINADSIYLNYHPKSFNQNRYDLGGVVTTVGLENDSTGLYYRDEARTVCLLSGANGYAGFKGVSFDFFSGGYFLPGNRFFIADIDSENFTGQVIIDVKTGKIMKMKKTIGFYFNINTNDCRDFIFKYDIEPHINYPNVVATKIRRGE